MYTQKPFFITWFKRQSRYIQHIARNQILKLDTFDQVLLNTREFTTISTTAFTTLVLLANATQLLLLVLEPLPLLDTRVAGILVPLRSKKIGRAHV